jgi:zinc transporter 1/2/3
MKSKLFILLSLISGILLLTTVSLTEAKQSNNGITTFSKSHTTSNNNNNNNNNNNDIFIIRRPYRSLHGSGGCPTQGEEEGHEHEEGEGEEEHHDDEGECVISDSDRHTLDVGKAVTIPIIFFLTFFASLLPWYLSRFGMQRASEIISILSCIAAGVIIGAAFSHMLFDAQDAFANYFASAGPVGLTDPDHVNYPFAPLIAIFVLLTLVGIDAYVIRRSMASMVNDSSHSSSQSTLASSNTPPTDPRHAPRHNHFIPHIPDKEVVPNEKDCSPNNGIEITKLDSPMSSTNSHAVDIENEGSISQPQVVVNLAPASHTHTHFEDAHHKADVASAWVFFFALAIHSIFDGLSVGAEMDVSGFYALLVAVAVHKGLDGFALGVPVYYAKFSTIHNVIILIFCAGMTPLGIGIGRAATSGYQGADGQLAKAIILSLSTGSFFFIGLMEMLPAGLADGKWIKLKIALVFIGWGIMALLALWV